MPPRENHLLCDRYKKEIEIRIAQDRVKGASQLYLDALKILKKWIEDNSADEDCFKRMLAQIVKGQPSMAPMLNLANNLLLALEEGWERVKNYIEEELEAFERRLEDLIASGVDVLSKYSRFATTSYSSTVREVFRALAENSKVSLLVAKGDPVPYGLRLADELFDAVSTIITTDALAPYLLKQVDAVVVGADSVDETGVVNGAGTFSLALAAKWYGVPFYVVCGTEKFLPQLLSRYHVIRAEEYPGSFDRPHRVEYRIFDVTPIELVSGFITERGLMDREEFLRYQAQLKVSPQFHSLLEI